jgi:hypothetical protein
MPSANDDRRGDDLITCKHGGGVGSGVAHGKRNVRLAGSLNTGGHSRPAKAKRKICT